MSSVCISKCVSDARDPRVPLRATYVNLYKWPESDVEFVRLLSSGSFTAGDSSRFRHLRIVDSVSCRQMYLRSYKFSWEETVLEKTLTCFGIGRNALLEDHRAGKKEKSKGKRKSKSKKKEKKCLLLEKVKNAFLGIFEGVSFVDRHRRRRRWTELILISAVSWLFI